MPKRGEIVKVQGDDVDQIASLPFVVNLFPFTREGYDRPPLHFLSMLSVEYMNNILIQRQKEADHLEVGRYLLKELESTSEELNTMIGKFFRRACVRVHPDRVGDSYAAEFAALNQAYQYMKDPQTRREYMWEMGPHNGGLTFQSHEEWVKKREAIEEGNTVHARYQAAVSQASKTRNNGATLQIEQGSAYAKPRRLRVRETNDKEKTADVEWEPPASSFQESCEKVFIVIDDETKIEIGRDELRSIFAEDLNAYRKTIAFPDWGVFSVTWYAHLLETDEKVTETQLANATEINLINPNYANATAERPGWIETARRETGRLNNQLVFFRDHPSFLRDRVEVKKRQKVLRRLLGSAQLIVRKLGEILRTLDIDASGTPELSALEQVMKHALVLQSRFVDASASFDKKDSLKSFAQSLESMIETGQAAAWISEVSAEELSSKGTSANRLFQLLAEGKKADSIFLDSTVLHIASFRSDLFSAKQCKVLFRRCVEVEAQREADEEKIRGEQEKKIAEEKQQKDIELRCNAVGIYRGALVNIVGLESQPEINGAVGHYMGLAPEGDRYVIRLLGNDAQDLTLEKKNFEPHYGVASFRAAPGEQGTTEVAPVSSPDIKTDKAQLTLDSDSKANVSTEFVAGFVEDAFLTQSSLQHWNAASKEQPSLFAPILHAPISEEQQVQDSTQNKSLSPSTVALPDGDIGSAVGFEAKGDIDVLLQFLRTQLSCLKCKPEDFCSWLLTQDVNSLSTLSDAVNDDSFMDEMQSHAVKGYKRSAFKNSISAAILEQQNTKGPASLHPAAAMAYESALDEYLSSIKMSHEAFTKVDLSAPEHLQCSISTVLMVVDPVQAADGYAYERHEIEAWMTSQREKGRPVTSPRTGQILSDLSLSPSILFRSMAREYLVLHSQNKVLSQS